MDSRPRRAGSLAAAVLCLPALAGCTAAAGQIYHSIRGGETRVYLLEPVKGPLDRFQKVRVEKFGNEVEAGIPPQVLERIETEIKRVLLEKNWFKGVEIGRSETSPETDPGMLVLRGVVIDYDPGKVAGRLFGVFGERFLTARVHFVDGGNGSVIGVGHVAGVVKGDIGRGIEDTATGLARGIAEVIDDNRVKKETK